ncbi:MAG: MFS transporter [Opitutaceae bacterium]|nr:MFS transporter [Opitutaceae bacterium]
MTPTLVTTRPPASVPSVAPSANPAWALASLSLAALLASIGASMANVALPALTDAFAAPFQAVQWVVLAYLLAVTTLIVGAGRLGDAFGPRRVLLAGMAVFAAASLLAGFAPSLGLLIAARAVQGLGAAAMMALSLSMIGASVPPDRTGRAMGLLGTMSAIGTALGPSLGGVLTAGPGWRMIFFVPVPLALAALVLARRHLPPDRPGAPRARGALDPAGTLLLAVVLAVYALALTLGRGHFTVHNAGLLALAAATAGALIVVEQRAAFPLLHVELLRDRVLRAGLASTALVTAVLMATLVVGPFHLTHALGLDAARVGLMLMVGPVVAALAGVPAGRLVDRWGAARISALGLLGVAIGSLMLAAMPIAWGPVGYAGAIVVLTAGYAFFQAANNTLAMTSGAPGQRGTVSGLLNLARYLGLITGASAMGAVFIAASGATDLALAAPAAVASGTRATFLLGAALGAAALVQTYRATRNTPARRRHDRVPAAPAAAPRLTGGPAVSEPSAPAVASPRS